MTYELKCPKCGSINIEYVEDALLYRTVYGVEDGAIQIEGCWKTSDGDNGRFSCNDCLEEFPVPGGLDIEWM